MRKRSQHLNRIAGTPAIAPTVLRVAWSAVEPGGCAEEARKRDEWTTRLVDLSVAPGFALAQRLSDRAEATPWEHAALRHVEPEDWLRLRESIVADLMQPHGVAVHLAEHAKTPTSVWRGVYTDNTELRREFLPGARAQPVDLAGEGEARTCKPLGI